MFRQLAVALAVSLPLAAQVSEQVPLHRIDVVVMDAEGNRVRGLKPADFEVVEGGERRGIVDFAEYSATAKSPAVTDTAYVPLSTAAAPPPRRRLAVVFGDDVSAAQREAAMVSLQKHTRGNDVVSVVTEGTFESRIASSVLQLARYPDKKAIVVYGEPSEPAIAFAKRRGVAIVKPEALEDLASYYAMSVRARDPGALAVKTTRPYTLRTMVAARPLESDDAFGDRVLLNHLIPQRNELKVDVAAAAVPAEGEKRTVKVNLLIPVANLALAREGDNVTGGFDVYVSVGDGKGNFASATKQTHNINWPAEAKDKAGDRKMNYAIDVVLDSGPARISVGVVDRRSKKTGFARIEVPG